MFPQFPAPLSVRRPSGAPAGGNCPAKGRGNRACFSSSLPNQRSALNVAAGGRPRSELQKVIHRRGYAGSSNNLLAAARPCSCDRKVEGERHILAKIALASPRQPPAAPRNRRSFPPLARDSRTVSFTTRTAPIPSARGAHVSSVPCPASSRASSGKRSRSSARSGQRRPTPRWHPLVSTLWFPPWKLFQPGAAQIPEPRHSQCFPSLYPPHPHPISHSTLSTLSPQLK